MWLLKQSEIWLKLHHNLSLWSNTISYCFYPFIYPLFPCVDTDVITDRSRVKPAFVPLCSTIKGVAVFMCVETHVSLIPQIQSKMNLTVPKGNALQPPSSLPRLLLPLSAPPFLHLPASGGEKMEHGNYGNCIRQVLGWALPPKRFDGEGEHGYSLFLFFQMCFYTGALILLQIKDGDLKQ